MECEGRVSDLEGNRLTVAKSVAPRLEKAAERLGGALNRALQAAATDFDPKVYDAALTAAIRLSKVGDVVGRRARPRRPRTAPTTALTATTANPRRPPTLPPRRAAAPPRRIRRRCECDVCRGHKAMH